jgi:hypothetical protein
VGRRAIYVTRQGGALLVVDVQFYAKVLERGHQIKILSFQTEELQHQVVPFGLRAQIQLQGAIGVQR